MVVLDLPFAIVGVIGIQGEDVAGGEVVNDLGCDMERGGVYGAKSRDFMEGTGLLAGENYGHGVGSPMG